MTLGFGCRAESEGGRAESEGGRTRTMHDSTSQSPPSATAQATTHEPKPTMGTAALGWMRRGGALASLRPARGLVSHGKHAATSHAGSCPAVSGRLGTFSPKNNDPPTVGQEFRNSG